MSRTSLTWCKLKKNHILNIRDANMFHNRVINFWNKLPDSVVLAASISSFKRLLLSLWWMLDLNIFLSTRFFLYEVLSFVALTNIVLWAPVSGGCILPWCPVQCLFCIWTNKLIDWLIGWLWQFNTFSTSNFKFLQYNDIVTFKAIPQYFTDTGIQHIPSLSHVAIKEPAESSSSVAFEISPIFGCGT